MANTTKGEGGNYKWVLWWGGVLWGAMEMPWNWIVGMWHNLVYKLKTTELYTLFLGVAEGEEEREFSNRLHAMDVGLSLMTLRP